MDFETMAWFSWEDSLCYFRRGCMMFTLHWQVLPKSVESFCNVFLCHSTTICCLDSVLSLISVVMYSLSCWWWKMDHWCFTWVVELNPWWFVLVVSIHVNVKKNKGMMWRSKENLWRITCRVTIVALQYCVAFVLVIVNIRTCNLHATWLTESLLIHLWMVSMCTFYIPILLSSFFVSLSPTFLSKNNAADFISVSIYRCWVGTGRDGIKGR